MAYRRIELAAAELDIHSIEQLLEDARATDRYRLAPTDDGPDRFSFVIDEGQTEHVTDTLQEMFRDSKQFQLIIYELSALWPMPDEDEQSKSEATKKSQGFGTRKMSREELLDDLQPGTVVSPVYIGQVLISCVVAAVGMMRNNVAMVIAAMVIAPLLLPNMSLALGTTLGDLKMIRRSLQAGIAGFAAGLLLSLLVGWTVPFDPSVREIAMRSEVRFSDMLVAIAAGAAGALAVTTGVSANLIGVMVAVALVPPLVAVGLLTGASEYTAALGAAILLATNIVCVNLAAVGVFIAQGIRPNTWYEEQNARRATIIAITFAAVLLIILSLLIWLAAPQNPLQEGM